MWQLALRRILRAGQRAATVTSLIQSAKLNGHDPYRYLKDVLERLPTQPASRLEELLPHRWRPTATDDRGLLPGGYGSPAVRSWIAVRVINANLATLIETP
jgi:hypothetical protein